MYHISPISADAVESKPFVMLPRIVCREEEKKAREPVKIPEIFKGIETWRVCVV